MDNVTIIHRDINTLGLPPVKDLYFGGFDAGQLLSKTDLSSGTTFTGREYIAYNLNQSVYLDYRDLARAAANIIVNNPERNTPRLTDLLMKPAPKLRYGEYKIRLSYYIPGQSAPNSTYEWRFFNQVPDNEKD
jgi:hypothetical protein